MLPQLKDKSKHQFAKRQTQSLSILQIAKQIVYNKIGYQEVVSLIKCKTNVNYIKFSQHITNILKNDQINLQDSFSSMSRITKYLLIDNFVGEHKANAILKGFFDYWASIKFKIFKQDFNDIFLSNVDMFPDYLWKSAIEFIINKAQMISYYEEVKHYFRKYIEKIKLSPNKSQKYKILVLFNMLNFSQQYDVDYIVNLALAYDYQTIKFIFNNPNFSASEAMKGTQKINYDIILNNYIEICSKTNNLEKAQAAIKDHNLNPHAYKNLIFQQQTKYVKYIYKQYPFFFIQTLVRNSPSLLEILILLLHKDSKVKEITYLVHQYKLNNSIVLKNIINNISNIEYIPKFPNILFYNDYFGATQSRVLGQFTKYLELCDFSIKEQDVYFVTGDKSRNQIWSEIMNSKNVGLDCQSYGGKTKYDFPKLSIAQFGLSNKIYIFDVIDLSKRQEFQQEINVFIEKYKGKVIGHAVSQDISKLYNSINCLNNSQNGDNKKSINLDIVDTVKVYKKIYPESKKSNLQHVCQVLFDRQMSKYEQCSAWEARPLRKSQMHYAAFDAFLPLKIWNKLC